MSEEAHWRTWLSAHGPSLVLLARQWTVSHADAEDAVQEGFLRFWRSRSKAADPLAYLFACVRGAAVDGVRSETRRRRRERLVRPPQAKDPMFEPPMEQEERLGALEAALATLPGAQREVIVMKVWGGLTFEQIAAAVGVPRNTAASRYRYGLDALRDHMSQVGEP